MIKVVKFGGSSVANATQFAKVKQIVESDSDRKFIVTSACGKESKEDHKITDLLYLCQAHVRYGVSYDSILSLIKEKYYGIKKDLNLKVDLDREFENMEKLMTRDVSTDYLVSRGEYMTGLLLAEYLNAVLIGKMGKTLSAFNTVIKAAVNAKFKKRIDILIDVNHYKSDRYYKLRGMAKRIGKQVQRDHVKVALDPMPNDERKVIHKALNEWHNIKTESEGEGSNRHVCISYVEDSAE